MFQRDLQTDRPGQVLIRGEPITKENIREVRKFVGIVFQNADDQIFSPTVEQDVAFGPTNLGLDEETIHHRVHEALKLVGIEDLAHRVPHHLSGGEKKRVAIAGIIAMEPEVLVLDEPTAGLDPQGVHDLVEFINSLSRTYGMTVIFSTHDVSMVAEVADYIYVMNKGQFVAEGSVEEIFLQPDLLRSVRLDVPVLPKLIRSLNRQGVPVPMAYTYEDVERALVNTYKGIPPGQTAHDRGTVLHREDRVPGQFHPQSRCTREDPRHVRDHHRDGSGPVLAARLYGWHSFSWRSSRLLWALSGLPWLVYAKRLVMVLPFGLFIIIFQIFFTNRYYSVFHVIADLPLGIHIYAESVEFALILLVKFIVCVSAIILLSSTTKLHDMLEGAGRMGLPPEFALTFGMMIRYLFVFGYIYRKINESLITRCFDPVQPGPPIPLPDETDRVHGRHHLRPLLRAGRAGVHEHALPRVREGQPHLCCQKTAPHGRVVVPCILPALCHCRAGCRLAECRRAVLDSFSQ